MLRPHVMYGFGISTTNAVILIMFDKDWRTFLKKIVFSSKGPPFGFWAVRKVVFWLREGQNLKISEVPIK